MRLFKLGLFLLLISLPIIPIHANEDLVKKYAESIDKALLKSGEATNFTNISDEVYLRRTYLNIIGRIPTNDEFKSFVKVNTNTRRNKLVQKLLASEEYREGMYPIWADMLRLQSRINGVYGDKYAQWVKTSIQENKPYDKMVYELIAAKGNLAQNPAVGYYLRDNGNILETASTTAQIFLGTQIGCAQCHDHAFEEWTQKQFYEFSAYMGKVTISDSKYTNEIRKNIKLEFFTPREKQIFDQVMEGLPFNVKDIDTKELKLPGDYKYKNAKPNEVVKPHVFLGNQPVIANSKDRRDVLAKWVTSKENPYFTKIIVNRLWKKVMGVALFEPVDDLNSNTHVNHPEVLALLEKTFQDLNFDTKKFLEVLYTTEHYQVPTSTGDQKSKSYCVLERPLLRMRAEQVWNSLLSLTRKNINEYYSNDKPQPIEEYTRKLQLEGFTDANLIDIWASIKEIADNEIKAKEDEMVKAKAPKKIDVSAYISPKEKSKEIANKNQMAAKPKESEVMAEPEPTKLKDRLQGLASDIPSPAPSNHFLQFFGQSSHLIIEQGNQDPTMPQVLALLNGQLTTQFILRNSYIKRQVNQVKENTEKIDYLYQVILTRKPTEAEKLIALNYLNKNTKTGIEDLMWVLVNTREFLFIQ
jgi:hypothetical protein